VSSTATRRDKLIEGLARQIERLGLTAPALLMLEAHKPLAFLASQGLLFTQPLLGFWMDGTRVNEYAHLLEDPATIEQLVQRLEAKEKAACPPNS